MELDFRMMYLEHFYYSFIVLSLFLLYKLNINKFSCYLVTFLDLNLCWNFRLNCIICVYIVVFSWNSKMRIIYAIIIASFDVGDASYLKLCEIRFEKEIVADSDVCESLTVLEYTESHNVLPDGLFPAPVPITSSVSSKDGQTQNLVCMANKTKFALLQTAKVGIVMNVFVRGIRVYREDEARVICRRIWDLKMLNVMRKLNRDGDMKFDDSILRQILDAFPNTVLSMSRQQKACEKKSTEAKCRAYENLLSQLKSYLNPKNEYHLSDDFSLSDEFHVSDEYHLFDDHHMFDEYHMVDKYHLSDENIATLDHKLAKVIADFGSGKPELLTKTLDSIFNNEPVMTHVLKGMFVNLYVRHSPHELIITRNFSSVSGKFPIKLTIVHPIIGQFVVYARKDPNVWRKFSDFYQNMFQLGVFKQCGFLCDIKSVNALVEFDDFRFSDPKQSEIPDKHVEIINEFKNSILSGVWESVDQMPDKRIVQAHVLTIGFAVDEFLAIENKERKMLTVNKSFTSRIANSMNSATVAQSFDVFPMEEVNNFDTSRFTIDPPTNAVSDPNSSSNLLSQKLSFGKTTYISCEFQIDAKSTKLSRFRAYIPKVDKPETSDTESPYTQWECQTMIGNLRLVETDVPKKWSFFG